MSNIETMTVKETSEWLSFKSSLNEEEKKQLLEDPRAGIQRVYRQWNNHKGKQEELLRHHRELLRHERKLWEQDIRSVAGIDEVGRGPLAGPVVAAAVILPQDIQLLGLTDSKKLTASKRESYFEKIKETALAYGIGQASSEEIDALNIYEATKLAMERAVKQLSVPAEYLLVDAMTLPLNIPQESIIKGDATSLSIAAASVLAKVSRDRMMTRYHQQFPHYHFEKNAGYGTKDHLLALEEFGPTPIHRVSFAPVRRASRK